MTAQTFVSISRSMHDVSTKLNACLSNFRLFSYLSSVHLLLPMLHAFPRARRSETFWPQSVQPNPAGVAPASRRLLQSECRTFEPSETRLSSLCSSCPLLLSLCPLAGCRSPVVCARSRRSRTSSDSPSTRRRRPRSSPTTNRRRSSSWPSTVSRQAGREEHRGGQQLLQRLVAIASDSSFG